MVGASVGTRSVSHKAPQGLLGPIQVKGLAINMSASFVGKCMVVPRLAQGMCVRLLTSEC
eukprot:917543-Prorocentrum_lima.AAC.1